jgi:hypothetical protein
MRNGGLNPLVLDQGSISRWEVSFTFRPLNALKWDPWDHWLEVCTGLSSGLYGPQLWPVRSSALACTVLSSGLYGPQLWPVRASALVCTGLSSGLYGPQLWSGRFERNSYNCRGSNPDFPIVMPVNLVPGGTKWKQEKLQSILYHFQGLIGHVPHASWKHNS